MTLTIPARALALCTASLLALPLTATASEADLMLRLDKLAAELDLVKAELAASRTQNLAMQAPATAPQMVQPQIAAPREPQTVLSGYGEINYNRPSKNASEAQTDVRRAVIGISHRFDAKTKLVTEFEWEHAVTSADDKGEAAVEQLYVEREFDNGLRAKAGLFLMPAGLLNTNHEPTAYYGVERNFVETAIIPSTWREAGLGLSSSMDNGITWDLGITTGFDLGKWNAQSLDGRESPLASIHQEGQLARSRKLSGHAALNWRGIPGLLLGGSLFTGQVSHDTNNANASAPDARVTLWDVHARYTPGKWDLAGVVARGTISHAGASNLLSIGNPTPIPSAFDGWYLQAAYQLWKTSDYALAPFVRYEQFNTARSYAAQPPGLTVAPGPTEKVTTAGANLRVGEGVVLKADYQKFEADKSRDRLNLAMGYAF
ncbi:MAG: hypothetical protein ACI83P_001174 [Janthinobacterium sp.]|jgi:hypothetical protein